MGRFNSLIIRFPRSEVELDHFFFFKSNLVGRFECYYSWRVEVSVGNSRIITLKTFDVTLAVIGFLLIEFVFCELKLKQVLLLQHFFVLRCQSTFHS